MTSAVPPSGGGPLSSGSNTRERDVPRAAGRADFRADFVVDFVAAFFAGGRPITIGASSSTFVAALVAGAAYFATGRALPATFFAAVLRAPAVREVDFFAAFFAGISTQ